MANNNNLFLCPVYVNDPIHYQGPHCGDAPLRNLDELYKHVLITHLAEAPWEIGRYGAPQPPASDELAPANDPPARRWKAIVIQKKRQLLHRHREGPPVPGDLSQLDVSVRAWLQLAKTLFPTLLGLRFATMEGTLEGSFVFRAKAPRNSLQWDLLEENKGQGLPEGDNSKKYQGEEAEMADADDNANIHCHQTSRTVSTPQREPGSEHSSPPPAPKKSLHTGDDGYPVSLSSAESPSACRCMKRRCLVPTSPAVSSEDERNNSVPNSSGLIKRTAIPSVARALENLKVLGTSKSAEIRHSGRICINDLLNPSTSPPPP